MNVGLDLVAIEEIRESLRVHGARYIGRIYTEEEAGQAAGAPAALAARFAAKEATMKALGRGDEPLPWRSIAVLEDARGLPFITLSGAAQAMAARRGIRALEVDLVSRGSLAGAIVVAESAGTGE